MSGAGAQAGSPRRRASRRTSGRTASDHRLDVAQWLRICVPGVLVLLALLPLWPVYDVPSFAVTAAGGVVLGTVAAVVAAHRRWGVLASVAALLVTFVLGSGLGAPQTALGGVVPTPATIGAVGSGVVTSWYRVLTMVPPLGVVENTLTIAYVMALVGAFLSVTVSVRAPRGAYALVVPPVVLVAAILFGTVEEIQPVLLALVVVLLALGWGTWRTGRLQLRRPLSLAVLGAVVIAGGLVSGHVARGEADRFVLREIVEPPLDLLDYPSPLAGFRSYLKDHREDTLLTVRGLPAGTPVRLATMDAYDGTTWGVASAATDASGDFRRVGDRIAAPVPEDAVSVEIEVGDYTGVWVPTAGQVYDIDFADPGQLRDFYYNRDTGTGVLTTGLIPGDGYELTIIPPVTPTASALDGAPTERVGLPVAEQVPDVVPAEAGRMVAEATTPFSRAQAIELALQEGYFSHGLEGDFPSLAGHGAARLTELFTAELMVGDEEQYAAAMALLGRAAGLPTRVVMGFAPRSADAEEIEITGDDVTAWVEIAFAGQGWVPFYPTPDEDRVPQDEEPLPQDFPQPQVLQPPPPVPDPPEPPPSDRDDVLADEDDPEDEEETATRSWYVYVIAGVPVLLLAPLLLIVLVKLVRRVVRRRRGTTTRRVVLGWRELVDQGRDLGVGFAPAATRAEASRQFDEGLAARVRDEGAGITTAELARRADLETFGPVPPDEAAATGYWTEVRSTTRQLRRAVGLRRWLRSRVSLRSLRKG